MSQSQKETPNPRTFQQTQQTKALTHEKRKGFKKSSAEVSAGTALVKSEISRSRQEQVTDRSTHTNKRGNRSLPKKVCCSSNSSSVPSGVFSQKKSSSDLEGKQHICSSHSDQEGLHKEGQFGRQVIAEHDILPEINVEMHEKKLQKGLKKLSAQSWPGRDRLVVFSDVFDDVCEGSPVFGRILREIKTAYDSYVNSLMASQSSLLETAPNTPLPALSGSKVSKLELEDAKKEVCMLEQEARGALEENRRLPDETQNVPAILSPEDSDTKNMSVSGLQDRGTAVGCTVSVQSKRLQVLNTQREIQQLEEEIKEKMVSTAATTAKERRIKDLKTEIMRLIVSNHRLRTTNKDLENNINMVLNREKASKAIRRMLRDEIHCDLQPESE